MSLFGVVMAACAIPPGRSATRPLGHARRYAEAAMDGVGTRRRNRQYTSRGSCGRSGSTRCGCGGRRTHGRIRRATVGAKRSKQRFRRGHPRKATSRTRLSGALCSTARRAVKMKTSTRTMATIQRTTPIPTPPRSYSAVAKKKASVKLWSKEQFPEGTDGASNFTLANIQAGALLGLDLCPSGLGFESFLALPFTKRFETRVLPLQLRHGNAHAQTGAIALAKSGSISSHSMIKEDHSHQAHSGTAWWAA